MPNAIFGSPKAARHDVIVNGDSGTSLLPGTLEALVRTLVASPDCGAVWAPYSVSEGSSIGTRLTRVAWTATTMNFLVVGAVHQAFKQKPMLAGGLFAARREAVAQIGGFAEADGYLTEDYEIGRRITANGWLVKPSRVPVVRHMGELTFGQFFQRQLRWNTILWRLRDPLRAPYPLTMCGLAVAPITCAAASLAFPERLGEYGSALAALYLTRGLYALLLRFLTTGARPQLETLLLLPLLDAVFLVTWARGPFVRTIMWRDTKLRVGREGKVTLA